MWGQECSQTFTLSFDVHNVCNVEFMSFMVTFVGENRKTGEISYQEFLLETSTEHPSRWRFGNFFFSNKRVFKTQI